MDNPDPRQQPEPSEHPGPAGPNDAPARHPDQPGAPGGPLPNPAGLRDPDPSPDDDELRRRDELADRVGAGSPSPAGRDRTDLLTGAEPPERPM